MAKEKAPKFKEIEYYSNIDVSVNPFAEIGDLIEDHNWEFELDRETGEFTKVPTRVQYLQCKGCDSCKRIKKVGKVIHDWKVAKIVTKPFEEWTRKEVLWLLSQRYSLRDISLITEYANVPTFLEDVKDKFDGVEGLKAIFFYNIPISIAKHIKRIDEEVFDKLREEYDEEYASEPIKFTEKVAR